MRGRDRSGIFIAFQPAGLATQRKPRIGTFSMPSKAGSTSRKASRMVLTCLRTLSRLRPLLTTSNSSS